MWIIQAERNAPPRLTMSAILPDLFRRPTLSRVMPQWEEPPVHMDLVLLDCTVAAGEHLLIEGGRLSALGDPQVIEAARRYGEPVALLDTVS